MRSATAWASPRSLPGWTMSSSPSLSRWERGAALADISAWNYENYAVHLRENWSQKQSRNKQMFFSVNEDKVIGKFNTIGLSFGHKYFCLRTLIFLIPVLVLFVCKYRYYRLLMLWRPLPPVLGGSGYYKLRV